MVERDALPADQRRFYDAVKALRRRPISGPFIVTMNSSPDLASRFAHLGHYFHARGQADESIVPLRVRGFIALLGARVLDGPYEWAAWVNWAIDAGVPRETADAIRERRPLTNLSVEEQLAADICTQLVSGDHRVRPDTFAAGLSTFGTQGLVEVVLTLGYFAMIALPLNAFEIEMSSEQKGNRKPFVPLVVTGTPGTAPEFDRPGVPPLAAPAQAMRLRAVAGHADVAPEHQHFVDRVVRTRGWLSPIFQVLLHAPDAAERVAHVGEFFLYRATLRPGLRALTWLFVARELDCFYVWEEAAKLAREAGIDDATVAAIERGTVPADAPAERVVLLDFCRQLLRGNHHVTDALYEKVVAAFGVPEAVQIAAALGYGVMISVVANAFEVPPASEPARPAL